MGKIRNLQRHRENADLKRKPPAELRKMKAEADQNAYSKERADRYMATMKKQSLQFAEYRKMMESMTYALIKKLVEDGPVTLPRKLVDNLTLQEFDIIITDTQFEFRKKVAADATTIAEDGDETKSTTGSAGTESVDPVGAIQRRQIP